MFEQYHQGNKRNMDTYIIGHCQNKNKYSVESIAKQMAVDAPDDILSALEAGMGAGALQLDDVNKWVE